MKNPPPYDYKKAAAERLAAEKKKYQDIIKNHPLPADIEFDDLFYPAYGDSDSLNEVDQSDYQTQRLISFELLKTERFGWVIPTLFISKTKTQSANRTYATSLDGKQCRVGNGPHILATLVVYVTKKNKQRLANKYLKLITDGMVSANETRDIISTRRMNGALRRNSWY
jgi:hypothetical protein